ncbi:Translation initiation factor eIF-2B subunit epsilon [Micractinium conductrix]|uniref:Translation initiation factor eIF2B subunit epsilon n=1 Tax=Micractinium conductrix TaxID=554055 RepID=A0A2P6VKW1_9CHLO|nr:Translation initiation factor eIF-2B subunit epsilon [Micractinium conductrix]|eukprot:PSC74700.1 Translation initiation factor eIF-2B subunit epsilon [Micractinium conductrix]
MQAVVLLGQHPALLPLAPSDGALLPVGGYPTIELTLRWLESAVSEIYVVTAGQADALTAYLQRAGWAGPARRGAAVHVVVAPGCTTEGEALRFVEQKDVIKSDFVLLSGSLLGNADLRPAMAAHLARRAADRQAIMTLLLHGGTLPPGEPGDCCLTVLDPLNQQLLRLEQGARTGSGGATLGTHIMGERNSVVVRLGVRLANIYICAPEVLVLLSDNFDYQSLTGDLVPGVLSEQELGSTLFVHELARGYVERISTASAYSGVVEDVVGRWAYPWVPDNSGDPQDLCRFNRGVYVDGTAAVASGARLSKGSMVGRGSIVEAGACLERSIVGAECHIGRGVALQGSCLHSGVRVDDNCRVSSTVLAEQVVVRSHARVETGVILAKRVVVDTAHCVPAGMHVSLAQHRTGSSVASDDELEWQEADDAQLAAAEAAAAALAAGGIPEAALNFDEHAVGPFGAGYAWAAAGSDSVGAQLPLLAGNQSPGSECDSEAEEFTKEVLGAEEPGLEEQSQGADQFNREVAETFLRCVKERISHDNAVIELNGLKIAEDRTFADCARYIFTTMLSLCLPAGPATRPEYRSLFPEGKVDPSSKEGCMELLRRINAQLRAWKALMQRFLRNSDDQVELLLTFEEYCEEEGDFSSGENGSVFAPLFPQVVKLCYDQDLLSEEAILDWAHEKEHAGEEDRRFVDMCADLLAWLEDAEEESSEEEDSE